ncbi:MAG: amidohydrolase family protein [Phycisphaerae bacterium]
MADVPNGGVPQPDPRAVHLSDVISNAAQLPEVQTAEVSQSRGGIQARRTTREGTQANAVNSQAPLPILDAHCHLGGVSLMGVTRGSTASKVLGNRVVVKQLSMLYYGSEPDANLAKKLVKDMTAFCKSKDLPEAVAAAAMVPDLAYCPLYTTFVGKNMTSVTSREVDIAGSEPLYYTHPNDRFNDKLAWGWNYRDRQSWEQALHIIAEASRKYAGQVFPFVGFDPRRPHGLEVVKEAIEQKGYVGVKMYSRTGWMPIHNRILYGKENGDELDRRMDEMFQYCLQHDLPMLVHCSPTGYPPDGMQVPMWTCTHQRKVYKYKVETGASPHGYGNIAEPLWPPVYTPEEMLKPVNDARDKRDRLDKLAILFVKWVASELANYCVHMQVTTSPYAWLPVMEKHNKLRLNLAHFGAEIGSYCTPSRNVAIKTAWDERIATHTYIAGGYTAVMADNRPYWRRFRTYFKTGVSLLLEQRNKDWSNLDWIDPLLTSRMTPWGIDRKDVYSHALAIYDGTLESDPEWKKWLDDWEQKYPYSWHEQIHEMIATSKYANLYTDNSFLTTDSKWFTPLFRPVIDEALGQLGVNQPSVTEANFDEEARRYRQREQDSVWKKFDTPRAKALREKLMLGTDWFMTEMDACGPESFWNMQWTAVMAPSNPHRSQADRLLWTRVATMNTLNWLNLKPRFNGQGMQKLEDFYNSDGQQHKLPLFWERLKTYYADDKRLRATELEKWVAQVCEKPYTEPVAPQPAVQGGRPRSGNVFERPANLGNDAPPPSDDSRDQPLAPASRSRSNTGVGSGAQGGGGGGGGGGTATASEVADLRQRVQTLESEVASLKSGR